MGNRLRNGSNWWTDSTGGVAHWIAAPVAVITIAIIAISVFSISQRPQATAARMPAATQTASPTPTPTPTKPTMAVFIGDSYTAGAGGTAGGFAPTVARTEGWAFENLGRGGTGYITNTNQSASDARNACARDYCESYPEMIEPAASLDPDIVIVSGGRNNARADEDDLREAVTAFYRDLRTRLPEAQIIATSPVWDASTPPSSLSYIADAVRESVESVGGQYIDLGQPFEGQPEYISQDEIHPNDKGYARLGELITASIVPVTPGQS